MAWIWAAMALIRLFRKVKKKQDQNLKKKQDPDRQGKLYPDATTTIPGCATLSGDKRRLDNKEMYLYGRDIAAFTGFSSAGK